MSEVLTVCDLPDCDRPVYARGRCRTCYSREYERNKRQRTHPQCSVEGCKRSALVSLGESVCRKHAGADDGWVFWGVDEMRRIQAHTHCDLCHAELGKLTFLHLDPNCEWHNLPHIQGCPECLLGLVCRGCQITIQKYRQTGTFKHAGWNDAQNWLLQQRFIEYRGIRLEAGEDLERDWGMIMECYRI